MSQPRITLSETDSGASEREGATATSTGAEGYDLDLIEDRAIASISDDKLAHEPLAHEVSALAQTVSPPATIGLFGPWGSGKSSLLGMIRTILIANDVAVVHLDAWKYAEIPLARQFVSETAQQLSQQRRQWLPGWLPARMRLARAHKARAKAAARLYESRKRRRFSLKSGRDLIPGPLVFLAVVSAFTFGATVVKEEPWRDALDPLLAPALLVSAIAALTTFALTALTVEVESSRPGTEEEFEDAFRGVTKKTIKKRKKIVFLVDELDRCPPSEVLATLETIRTFLEVEGCIFIVSGDRQVIEDALRAAPKMHGAPPRPPTAYYAMAGAFLDKIFQIQLDIPPLNEERMTDFVFRLLKDQKGVWTELELGELVPILIPSHVRSPRRAKVLLNGFVLALRQTRRRFGVDSEKEVRVRKELALAKLVVLRTEFPLFADQLPEHPSLVQAMTEYLVAKEEANESDDESPDEALMKYAEPVQELVRDFVKGKRQVEPNLPSASDRVEQPVTSADNAFSHPATQRAFHMRRTDELFRYLTSTVDTPNPDRDLIFGTSIGQIYDLDPEVATAIEAGALDGRPREVQRVFEDLDPSPKVAAVKLICDLATKQGLQGRRAMEALLVALRLSETARLDEAGSQLGKAITTYTSRYEIPDDWISILLNVSRALSTNLKEELQTDLLQRESWRQTDEVIKEVFKSAGWWAEPSCQVVTEALPALIETHADASLASLVGLDNEDLSRLWDKSCWTPLSQVEEEDDRVMSIVRKLGEANRTETWNAISLLFEQEKPEFALSVAAELGGATDESEQLDLLAAVSNDQVAPTAWSQIAELLNV